MSDWTNLCSAMQIRVNDVQRDVQNLSSELLQKSAELRGLREGLECIKSAMPKGEVNE